MGISGTEVATAFNQQNEKRGWTARAASKPEKGLDLVHFTAPSGLVSLIYNAVDGRFQVKFHKLQATWGDYVKAIAKSLYYVLTVLKSAGLPFDAPLTYAGIQVVATAAEDSTVYVEWPGMHKLPHIDWASRMQDEIG
jgi:hypothetical protein